MSNFTIMVLSFVALAFIGRYLVNINDPILRNNKYYRIFVIICGLIALILVSILSFNILKIILSIIKFFIEMFA